MSRYLVLFRDAPKLARRCTAASRKVNDDGFSLVELLMTLLVTSIVIALVIPMLEVVTNATQTTQQLSVASGQASLAVENLQAQVSSASQVCLPTQLTTGGLTVSSGFAVRVEQVTSSTSNRWEQWTVNSGGKLEEEQFTPAGTGTWIQVASGVVNSATAPFSLPSSASGSPARLGIDLQLESSSGPTVEFHSSASAYASPYTLAPTTPCSTAEPEN